MAQQPSKHRELELRLELQLKAYSDSRCSWSIVHQRQFTEAGTAAPITNKNQTQ